MRYPMQAKPVMRRSMTASLLTTGVRQSDCCGSGQCCVGACIPFLNTCAGVCVPNVGQC
jgi:hypothetical protein